MAYTLHPEVKRVLHLMYAYKMSEHTTKVIIFCLNYMVLLFLWATVFTISFK